MSLSSPGIGSGLDVQGIVSQLVAIEKKPLENLKTQATSIQTRLSTYGTIKSQFAALSDAANQLSTVNRWNVFSATSSNTAAATVTATSSATAGRLSLDVVRLAQSQSTSSAVIATDSAVGGGSMRIELGRWAAGVFTSNGTAAATVTIDPADTITQVATKINQSNAGVTATVLRDASGERLMVRSTATGEMQGFRIEVTDDDGSNTNNTGLSRLAYDTAATGGMTLAQAGTNAEARINNVVISSATNRLNNTIPGLDITLAQVTTTPVDINVQTDTEQLTTRIQAFVDAYNTLNNTLSNALRYDPGTKTGGPLQGDSTTVGLQSALRAMMRSVSASTPFSRLLDIGIATQPTGSGITLDKSKLSEAMATNLGGVRDLFTLTNNDQTLRGFGLKVKGFSDGVLNAGGTIDNKTRALELQRTRNQSEQDRVNDRAQRAERRLLSQFTKLDGMVAQYGALGNFVNQQLAIWNAQKS